MPKRSFISLLILVLLLAACAPLSHQPDQSNLPPAPTETPIPEAAELTAPLQVWTPTPTPAEQVVVLTHEPHNIVMTAISLQLENNQIQLTAAADQIATLKAESSALETQVVSASTQAAATAQAGTNSSSPASGGSSNYELPANVYPVVTVADKAFIFIFDELNDNDAPIMEHYEPRVWYPPGTETWVYKKAIKADGGQLFYEVYDPDGKPPPFKVYFKSSQIQVRAPYGKPNPNNYPADVAKAEVINKLAIHSIVGYDNQNKPIMETYKPAIYYNIGQTILVYPNYVVATGGSHWVAVYDPDGQPSGYVWLGWIEYLPIWE